MSYESKLADFKGLVSKIEYLKYTLNSLVYWDKITNMPKGGIEYRSQVMSFMADEQYKLLASKEFKKHVAFFDGHKKNDEITNAMIRKIKKNSQFVSKIPEEEYQEYIQLIALSEQIWDEAREEDDFEKFRPYLERIVETFTRFAGYWGNGKDPYEALMFYYEDGITLTQLDEIVEELKAFLIDFIEKIKEKEEEHIGDSICFAADMETQTKLWRMITEKVGFDFNFGRIDMGSHTTILANSPSDVRIVNTGSEENLRPGLYNVLHSCGKGIYQQSISKDLLGTFLAEVPSFALEEAIGKFYENIIGRSKGFFQYFYEPMKELIPSLDETTAEEIYERVNTMTPSAIRLEADELTYLIHIIIRYEIERDLIHGKIKVKDLPEIWKEKYEAYLGITPKTDREGVLQDIHWAAGYMGYFPSYFLANIAAAQLAAAIEKDEGNLEKLIGAGGFGRINEWLKEKIFCHGAVVSTAELIERATGEPLNARYYIDYLRNKYSEVYKLSEMNAKEN